MNIETKTVHAGSHADPASGAVIPPIVLSSTYQRGSDGSYESGYKYSRHNNPNRLAFEQCLCELEGGKAAAAFASGSAAAMGVFLALKPGDHIIAPAGMYHGVALQLRTIMSNWNLQTSFVNTTNLDEVKSAIKSNTRLIFIETPSNPMMDVTDIAGISEIAKKVGIKTLCDSTFGTPVLQQPFKFGIDLILHATTKYLGGHSDLIGGIIISREEDEFFTRIKEIQTLGGGVPSPFDCYLALRGIRTLALRMQKHSENAMAVAEFLESHPDVESVFYPGLKSNSGHSLAKSQMSAFGGMIAFKVKDGKEKAFKIASKVKIFTRATSLGGTESLIEHRASMEGANPVSPDNLLRLSIGLENANDLIEDLNFALK